jgi:hypothetical protein
MTIPSLTIGGRRLIPIVDIEETKRQITDAVRRGGGFVTLASASRIVEVMITPATPITVEHALDDEPDEAFAAAGASQLEEIFPSFDSYGI